MTAFLKIVDNGFVTRELINISKYSMESDILLEKVN